MSYVERSAIRKTLDGDLVQLVGDVSNLHIIR